MDLTQEKTPTLSMGDNTDFFTNPSITTAEEDSYVMRVFPVSSMDNEAPLIYEFDIDDSHYADLSHCFHYLTFKINKSDRSPITPPGQNAAVGDDQKVAPINYYGNTIFENVELYLNGNLIESSNGLYPYKSYMQTFLSYSENTKDTQLGLCGFFKDTDKIDSNDIRTAMNDDGCANKGLHKRYELSHYSKPITTISPVHLDFSTQERYVQNRSHVKIKLTRAKNSFSLIANAADKNFTLVFQRAYLLIRMIKPRDSLRLAVEQTLETTNAIYPVKQCEMRYYTFPGAANSFTEPNLYNGHLPTRIALGLVDADALDGNFKKSPFNFKTFSINEIDVKVNGKSITNEPLKVDIENKDYGLPYLWLYQSTGGLTNNENLINYQDYSEGNFILVFDLTKDNIHGIEEFHPPESGIISVDFRLARPNNHAVALVAMFEREKIITCNKERVYNVLG